MSTDRIKRLQRQLKLDADGVIGPATISALENVIFGQTNFNKDKSMKSALLPITADDYKVQYGPAVRPASLLVLVMI